VGHAHCAITPVAVGDSVSSRGAVQQAVRQYRWGPERKRS
jgi:hypothetical protein